MEDPARVNPVIGLLTALTDLRLLSTPAWRRVLLLMATLGFGAGFVLSVRHYPHGLNALQWTPLVLLAAVSIPVTIVLNTSEFVLSGRLIGTKLTFLNAMETTIIGGVANMLPLPGGIIVRVAALKAAGASVKRGSLTIVFNMLIWFGVAFAYSGVWIAVLGSGMAGPLFLAGGIAILIGAFATTMRYLADWRVTLRLTINKLGLVLIDAARIYLCLWALSVAGGFGQASALTASGALGNAISFVPAGLGVREGVAALLAPFVGLPPASAFLATSLNRLVGLAVTAPIALWLSIRQKSAP